VAVEREVDAQIAQTGIFRDATSRPVSGCTLHGRSNCTARTAVPLPMSSPTPTAPWCRLALPSEAAVDSRIMDISG
jgi:hypothetical protein